MPGIMPTTKNDIYLLLLKLTTQLMKIINLLSIVIIALIFNSCQKGITGGDPVIPDGDKLTTYTEDVHSL